MSDRVTIKELENLLTDKYGCKCRGQMLAKPYCDQDDMPLKYESKTGHIFSVPLPINGMDYHPDMVQLIISTGRLNVVVSLHSR